MVTRALPLAAVVVLFTCSSADAQDAGKVGFDFRVADQHAIGVTWHVTDRFALRPLLTYDSHDVTFFDPFFGPYTERAQVYGADLGVLVTARSHEDLNLYTGIALQYNYTSVDVGADSHSKGAQILFGMRYVFAKRLGLFGEVGARYLKNDNGVERAEYGLFTAGLGAIIYLN